LTAQTGLITSDDVFTVRSNIRDNLPDGGGPRFAETIKDIHELDRDIKVEVLIPDFGFNLFSIGVGFRFGTKGNIYYNVNSLSRVLFFLCLLLCGQIGYIE
jgi:hypothetical protein